MARFEMLAVGLVLAVAFGFVACAELQSYIKVVLDMQKFLIKNPDLKLQPLVKDVRIIGPSQFITPLELVEEAEVLEADAPVTPSITRTYRIGYRVAGDRLLAQDQAQQSWSKPQDVTKNLYYPQNGIGAVVTYLEISVDQSTNIGQAHVIGGGIGQRSISVVIEARSTLYFDYRAAIYGY